MLCLRNIRLGYGGPLLLDDVNLELRAGERVCLLGRNGAGKSSLLKIVARTIDSDVGEREEAPALRIAFLQQETDHAFDGTVEAVLHAAAACDAGVEAWEARVRVERVASALGLPPAAVAATLSVGMRRRLVLAACLVREPELLVLDEPTNHLDLIAIAWLESFLPEFPGCVLFTTHDRAFMRRMATRILDLERGRLTAYACDYPSYLQRKDAMLAAEAVQQAAFDKKLAAEEAWIRQGVQARRTRNEGRVRALHDLRRQRQQRRQRSGVVKLDLDEAERSGAKVITAKALTLRYADRDIVRDFSALVCRGDRIGLVGPNGAGKTTLIKGLLGEMQPSSGSLTHGTRLEIAYFDQTREQLPENATVAECIADGAMEFEYQGRRRHVISYLRDFLFTADRIASPVRSLSGGERNRLLLARLFTRPFNLLVLDEPTNDLDLETLELLEEKLLDYSGTLLLVSHDRAFLCNVTTSLIVLDGQGGGEWVHGVDEDDLPGLILPKPVPARSKASERKASGRGHKGRPRTFLNRERRELEALPGEIEILEQELESIAADFASGKPEVMAAARTLQAKISELETSIATKYARWEELEALQTQLAEAPDIAKACQLF